MKSENIQNKPFDLVIVGEINVDLILKGNVVPSFGQIEQIVDEANIVMGSSAVIFACGIEKLGLRTAFIGKVGDDLFGHFMIQSMQDRGIDTTGVVVDPAIQTGLSVILANSGDRAILTFPGSIPELYLSDINDSLISKGSHLHLSSYFLLDRLRPDITILFKKAKEMGLTISLDTNYDPRENWDDGLKESLPLVDVFLPNETEAKAISREKSLAKAIDKLAKAVPTLAIKLGEAGAVSKWKDSPTIQHAAIPVDIADTVGAGDSFDAGFIYGFLKGWSPDRTLKLAVTCGTLSTQKLGGTAGQPSLKEALEFMQKVKNY